MFEVEDGELNSASACLGIRVFLLGFGERGRAMEICCRAMERRRLCVTIRVTSGALNDGPAAVSSNIAITITWGTTCGRRIDGCEPSKTKR